MDVLSGSKDKFQNFVDLLQVDNTTLSLAQIKDKVVVDFTEYTLNYRTVGNC